MTKTIFFLTHVDAPNEDIIEMLLNLENMPQYYWELSLATEDLRSYHEQGLEYEIRTMTININ